MATAFENGFAAVVLVGGVVGGIAMGIGTIGIAIFGKDEISEQRNITLPTSAEEMFVVEHNDGSGPAETFKVPARLSKTTVEMAIVEPKWAKPDELADAGYRHANLAECRIFLEQLRVSGRNISYDRFMCFGSITEKHGRSYKADIQFHERNSRYHVDSYNEEHVRQFSIFDDRKYLAVKE